MACRKPARLGRRPHRRTHQRHPPNGSGGTSMTRSVRFHSRALRLSAALLTASVAAIPFMAAPAHAQFGGIVYDPTNYAQNLLTATRALQQIKNQNTSPQNEATGLLNQTRNLTTQNSRT